MGPGQPSHWLSGMVMQGPVGVTSGRKSAVQDRQTSGGDWLRALIRV